MNVFTNLKAYTLPLVISAFEQVGWPARIECQPQPQRGQLKVALAVELAYAFASLLSQALSGWHTERGLPGAINDNANDLDTHSPNKPQRSKSNAIYNEMLHLEFSAFAHGGSPIVLLKSRGGDWWDAYVAYVAGRILEDLEGDIYSIALRDPNILWAIYQVDRAGEFIGTPAVLEVLHEEVKLKQVWLGMYPGNCPIKKKSEYGSIGLVKKTRRCKNGYAGLAGKTIPMIFTLLSRGSILNYSRYPGGTSSTPSETVKRIKPGKSKR